MPYYTHDNHNSILFHNYKLYKQHIGVTMKITIINTLVLIMIFNLIMLIFPEGKTQKFCSISIKTLIMIFILDNIILNGSIDLDILNPKDTIVYEREINVSALSQDMVDSVNNMLGRGETVKDIILCFTDSMDMKANVVLYDTYGVDTDELRVIIAEIFNLNDDNIDFLYGGIHE